MHIKHSLSLNGWEEEHVTYSGKQAESQMCHK